MIIHVPLDQIDDNPFQRRQDYGDVEGLAADIAARGLLQTPVGRLVYDHGEPVTDYGLTGALDRIRTDGFPAGLRVQLAFGHRRLRAYRHLAALPGDDAAEFTAMPIEIVPYTDDGMLDAVWSENQHRSDINAIEQAELLAEKLERARAAGGNQSTVAAEWRIDRSTVANKLRLLELPTDVQTAVRERRLSERQAQALLPVLELDKKLNGAKVGWSDAGGESWRPASPAGFLAAVLEKPERATSDAIRDYTRAAERHAGEDLPDAFATFEAGEGPEIVQSACKGCDYRHNQTCLRPACHEARYGRLLAALPQLGAQEPDLQELPYSDDADDFPADWRSLDELETAWRAGERDGMVWGINVDEARVRPFEQHYRRYAGPSAVREDWRLAIGIGRRQPVVEETDPRDLPDEADLERWKKAQAKADRERTSRAKTALRSRVSGLAADETSLRALAAMLTGYELRQFRQRGETPAGEDLFEMLFEYAWKHAEKTSYDGDNRDVLAKLLDAAAINPVVVDPAEPALRLADIGQLALLDWSSYRGRPGPDEAIKRLSRLRDAIAEFDRQPAAVYGSEELQRYLEYLREAVAVEEQLAYPD